MVGSPDRLAQGARLEVVGDADVRRVIIDSRRAQDGDCFVAVRGTVTDGHGYIAQAVASGCTAVVCENATAVPHGIAHAVAADTRQVVGPMAQAALGWPSRKLPVVGVTGTNGKTTFSYLLRDILRAAGQKPAMLGTIVYDTLAHATQAGTTTPSPVQLAELMAEALAAGATHVVMEISSHALDQHRTDGIDVDVGVFTNLSRDHLDYHGTMANYLAAKRRLFRSLGPEATAVLNRDDEHADELAEGLRARKLWYGLSGASEVYARIGEVDVSGSRFTIVHGDQESSVATALTGRHNIYNCVAAAATAIVLGIDQRGIAAALSGAACVPGRLQPVPVEAPFRVLVDYAHTDDALRNVLSSLEPFRRSGRLILVFGCGGDRDRTKRPEMARVAEEFADVIVVTSDNPRSEDPESIIDEILVGFSPLGMAKVTVEPDRRLAIAAALDAARPGDVVLIAGKGHEDYQIVGGVASTLTTWKRPPLQCAA
ncbi:hypothetical protein LCGC14_2403080, partial [marine sediment metagenome]